jgi:hypothetical protein
MAHLVIYGTTCVTVMAQSRAMMFTDQIMPYHKIIEINAKKEDYNNETQTLFMFETHKRYILYLKDKSI